MAGWFCPLKYFLSIACCLLVALSPYGGVEAGERPAGQVSTVSGEVFLKRPSGRQAAAIGSRLAIGDIVETGADGAVGLLFDDDTTISLGPGSRLEIQEFLFQPEESEFSFVVKLFHGTAVYVSGFIAKISSKATRFITPSASIGIRGTMLAIQVEES